MKEAYQMSRIEKETVETDMLKQKNYMRNELTENHLNMFWLCAMWIYACFTMKQWLDSSCRHEQNDVGKKTKKKKTETLSMYNIRVCLWILLTWPLCPLFFGQKLTLNLIFYKGTCIHQLQRFLSHTSLSLSLFLTDCKILLFFPWRS